MILKPNLFLALSGAFFLSILLMASSPQIGSYISIIPHDGFVNFKGTKNYLINFDSMSISSMAYLSVIPQELFSKVMGLIFGVFGNEILSRIGLIPVFYLISTFLMLTRFNTTYFGKATIALASLLIWLNIGAQWHINSGVGMDISEQLTLFFITILFVIVVSYDSKNCSLHDLRFLVSISFLTLFSAIFTYSKVIPAALAVAAAVPLFWSNRKIIFKDKSTRFYVLLMLVFLTSIGSVFYLGLAYNNFQIYTGTFEGADMGLSNAAGGNLDGGLLYQILGFNNWTLYTRWDDRLFGQMNFGIEKLFVQVLLLLLFATLPLILIAKFDNKSSLICVSLFILFTLFLSKSNQPPLGDLFSFIIENIKVAQSIRTPDTKFGIYISCAIIVLIIASVQYLNTLQLISLSGGIILYLTILIPPMYHGETIFGCQKPYYISCSYVVDTSSEKQISEIIASLGDENTVLLIPGFGNINTRSGRIGWRDPISVYLPNSRTLNGTLNTASGTEYISLLNNFNISLATDLGIKIFFIRKSWLREKPLKEFCLQCLDSSSNYKKVFEDKYTLVYAILDSTLSPISNSIPDDSYAILTFFKKIRLFIIILLGLTFAVTLIYLMKKNANSKINLT